MCNKDAVCLGHSPASQLPKEDLEAAIRLCVRRFYERALEDPVLGPIMRQAIGDLDGHIATVSDFWSHSLLGTDRYQGRPYPAHVALPIEPEHFERWLSLFADAACETLPGLQAAQAIAKSQHVASCFKAGLFPFTTKDGRLSRHPDRLAH